MIRDIRVFLLLAALTAPVSDAQANWFTDLIGRLRGSKDMAPVAGVAVDEDSASFDDCPADGDAAINPRSDRQLHLLKNRRSFPRNGFKAMNFGAFLKDVPTGVSKRHRDKWPKEDLAVVRELEKQGASVEGYLVDIKMEGAETVNCRSEIDRDFHLWLAPDPNSGKKDAIVVEVTPRVKSRHIDTWTLANFREVISKGPRVRISGWPMLDQEHAALVGKSRATMWEIHPVLKIEIWSGRKWVAMD